MEDDDFAGAMPKEEIGALQFIETRPQSDGRGVLIAILDSGVDPGAAGLQVTRDGKPKIVDLQDCTGSGDVDTSKVVKAEAGKIKAPDGLEYELNPQWVNPTGEWRVGLKRAFDLFTAPLIARLRRERRKRWDAAHRRCVTAALAAVHEFEASLGTPPRALTDVDTRYKADLEARIKLLEELDTAAEDPGPMLVCVVWHDGYTWRAALDSSQLYEAADTHTDTDSPPVATTPCPGRLAASPALTDFFVERQFGTLSPGDSCNYAVNIFDDGALLSIVTDSSPHGTHVAGIAAAYFPDDETHNGVAPGAQIISCKIGDNRLGGLETGVGLTRALATVLRRGCHLINMSYGEPTALNNDGRFVALAEELVHKHNVTFVSSAGNNGPALSTVGAPGGTSSAIIGVGAFVSPALAAAAHSLREPLRQGLQYTWSSRGPTTDGDLGVSLSAPGGAIAPVPNWTLEKKTLMNGTSMSAPCVCGGLALVLSAAKQARVPCTPTLLRRAAETSAVAVDSQHHKCTYGHGLLQVGAAYDRLRAMSICADVRYDVSVEVVGASGTPGRGIYVREPLQWLANSLEARCTITPKMHEDAANTLRTAFEQRLSLRSTATWLACPDSLLLTYNGRGFSLRVDLTAVPPGEMACAEVLAFEGGSAGLLGPVFRVPVTLVRPLGAAGEPSVAHSFPQLPMHEGTIQRRFMAVPDLAQWAEIFVTAASDPSAMDNPRSFMLQCVHARPNTRRDDDSMRHFFSLAPGEPKSFTMPVVAGTTLEVALAQFWLSLGSSAVTLEVAFHAVTADPGGALVLHGAAQSTRVDCWAPLRMETLQPAIKLTTVITSLRPTTCTMTPLTAPRDALPNGRVIHALVLTYTLQLRDKATVTPRLEGINRQVYDGEFEAQMYMIFDSNKQRVALGDIYPAAVKLPKGKYTVRVLLRHDRGDLLAKFKATALLIERTLDEPLSVKCHKSARGALVGNASFDKATLPLGHRCSVFLGGVPDDKLPKDAVDDPTAALSGTVTWAQSSPAAGGGACPAVHKVWYLLQAKAPDAPAAEAAAAEEAEEDAEVQAAEAAHAAKVTVLKDMKVATPEQWAAAKKSGETLKTFALTTKSKHLVLEALLSLANNATARKGRLMDVILIARELIAAVEVEDLTRFAAMKCSEEGVNAGKRKKEMDRQRAVLVSATQTLCTALLDLAEGPAVASSPPPPPPVLGSAGESDLDAAFRQLRRWDDPAPTLLGARWEARRGNCAAALASLAKTASESDGPPPKEAYELKVQLLETLGWTHLAERERSCQLSRFPADFAPF